MKASRLNNKAPERVKIKKPLWGEISGLFLLGFSLFIFFLLFFPREMGVWGETFNRWLFNFFGSNRYFLILLLLIWGSVLLFPRFFPRKIFLLGYSLFLFLSLQVLFYFFPPVAGGWLGALLGAEPGKLLGEIGAAFLIILVNLLVLAFVFPGIFRRAGELIKAGIDWLISAKSSQVLPEKKTKKPSPALEIKEALKSEESPKTPQVEDRLIAPLYRLPETALLNGLEVPAKKKAMVNYSEILVDTLASFGVEAKVVNTERGPTVTRYELQPARGVKVSRITNLVNDIALVLAAPSIRIEAPVPGKSVIGVEVPNERIDVVSLREILESQEAKKQGKFSLALGKDITGKAVVDDLLKMPHLLIAGATGSGKTICLNAVICSMLFNLTPLEVQFLMIDPKRVELSIYETLPHLVDTKIEKGRQIVTDPRIATLFLKQLTRIMEERYELFAQNKVRNIIEYNQLVKEKPGELIPAPYIVVVIDELADLMMVSSATVETYICRLAQLGRASGIHLIIATQRPSVDVITGLIKANIPSRIAFAVSSQVDSRVILDRVGAEKLLGKGDMLYLPIDAAEPRRIQGTYIDSKEIERLVEFWSAQPLPEYKVEIKPAEEDSKLSRLEDEAEELDSLIPQALGVIRETGQASASMLQRRLRIGYARAGRLMDILEQKGIVGPPDGSKPRKILISVDQLEAMAK